MAGMRSCKIAAIDCGTNSIKMKAEKVTASPGGLKIESLIPKTVDTIRLGEGVEASGRLSEAALSRLETALRRYRGLIRSSGPEIVKFVATSAVRDAENSEAFSKTVESILGVSPKILSGSEEAELGFCAAGGGGGKEEELVVDLGGGSTEFSMGKLSKPCFVKSVNVGCVRVSEMFCFSNSPLSPARQKEAGAFVRSLLMPIPIGRAKRMTGISGSIASISFMAKGKKNFEPGKSFEVEKGAALLACQSLMEMGEAEMREYRMVSPLRRKIIRAGALIFKEVLLSSPLNSYRFSDATLLDGVILSSAKSVLGQW